MRHFRRLYDWVLSWADRRGAQPALFGIAAAEASVLPIPPDPLLMALTLGKPKCAWRFAFICTAGSVLGGCLGYFLGIVAQDVITAILKFVIDGFGGGGSFLGTAVSAVVLDPATHAPMLFGSHAIYEDGLLRKVMNLYNDNAFLAVLGAAITPIPYKIFTIAGGYSHINFATFVVASVIGRGGRYLVLVAVIYFFGEKTKALIDRYFGWLTIAFFVLLVGGFVGLKYVF